MKTDTTAIAVYRELVYRELQKLTGRYLTGIPVCRLEACYRGIFNKPLDYRSLGVSDIEELLANMGPKLVVFEAPKRITKYVMPACMVEFRQVLLKERVQELLDRYRGVIDFDGFEDSFMDHFKMKINYLLYGLADLEKLCEAFKDILVVDTNPSGVKVIKAKGMMPYNLRKRKASDE